MRRIAFALILLSAAGWAEPSRAQWWGWGRPCVGAFGPGTCPGGGWARPGRVVELVPLRPWAGPVAFGPRAFPGPGWFWRRWAWRREMRLRRIENWRRWVEASRQAEPAAEAPRPWSRRVRPSPVPPAVAAPRPEARARIPVFAFRPPADERRAAAAVALMPATAQVARPHVQAAVPSPLLAAAARRPALPTPRPTPVTAAALRVPEPPARPRPAHRVLRPAVLRNEPAPAVPAPAVGATPASPAAAEPASPARAEPAPAAPADVPVAPLD